MRLKAALTGLLLGLCVQASAQEPRANVHLATPFQVLWAVSVTPDVRVEEHANARMDAHGVIFTILRSDAQFKTIWDKLRAESLQQAPMPHIDFEHNEVSVFSSSMGNACDPVTLRTIETRGSLTTLHYRHSVLGDSCTCAGAAAHRYIIASYPRAQRTYYVIEAEIKSCG